MRLNALILFITALFSSFALEKGFAMTAQEIARKAFKSTVMLSMEDKNGHPLALGSGFFINKDTVITNFHVIEGAYGGFVNVVGSSEKFRIKGTIGIDKTNDLAVVVVSNSYQKDYLSIADSSKTEIGETIYAVGNPKGLEGTFSQGIISSKRKIENQNVIQITAPISSGSSGGPILNSEGQVIGVAVAGYREGQNLNFAVPANLVSSLLKKSKNNSVSVLKGEERKKTKTAEKKGTKNLIDAVIAGQFLWESENDFNGDYSISILNTTSSAITNIYGLIIFYTKEGYPIDYQIISYTDIIPGRLAKRINKEVDVSVKKLTTRKASRYKFSQTPRKSSVAFRILSFDFLEDLRKQKKEEKKRKQVKKNAPFF